MAKAALAGIEPSQFMSVSDHLEAGLLSLVANKAIELQEEYRKAQAQHIINELGKAMNKGSRKRQSSSSETSTA